MLPSREVGPSREELQLREVLHSREVGPSREELRSREALQLPKTLEP
jgi:hypothetical protein